VFRWILASFGQNQHQIGESKIKKEVANQCVDGKSARRHKLRVSAAALELHPSFPDDFQVD